MAQAAETVREVFLHRLGQDELINFSMQGEITEKAAKLWQNREQVTGEAAFIPAPESGFFPDGKDIWGARIDTEVQHEYPYIWSAAVDSVNKLLAATTRGLQLKEEGKRPTLVTNFIMEQRMERETNDQEGKLHGVRGIEMPLLQGVIAFLAQGFPRGLIHVEGHGLGLEYYAGKYNLPVLTLTAMPKLLQSAVDHEMVERMKTVVVSGDVGGVMMMNHVAELASNFGLQVERVCGEKRAANVFTSRGREKINGAQILFGDDIISSGRTVFDKVLKAAFVAGASKAIVLVPHTDLTRYTLDNLNKCAGDVNLVVGDTFPIRSEVVEAIETDNRILRVPVFASVVRAAEMDAHNLLADIFTNPETQELLLQTTGLSIFAPYFSKYRTVADMLE